MPTAANYRTWAQQLKTMNVDLVTSANQWSATGNTQYMQGGSLTRLVDRTINALSIDQLSVAASVAEAAAECDRRADVCDSYREQMNLWHRAMSIWQQADENLSEIAWHPPPPRMPSRPASWVN
jgi:hypothetical protein